MNDNAEDNPINHAMEILIEHGFGGIDQAMAILISGLSCRYSDSLRVTALLNNARPSGRVSTFWKETRPSQLINGAPHWRRNVWGVWLQGVNSHYSTPITR
jgi:hypothetical protein